jgi:hypothetical protein
MTVRSALAALLCLLSTASGAATLEGVTFPDTYPLAGQRLVLNGMGLRTVTFLGIKIYVAALYLPRPSHDPAAILASDEPKVLLLRYLYAGSKQQVEKEYREGEQTNCGDGSCPGTDATDFERLVAAAPAVKVGDTTTYIITDSGLSVLANNQPIGQFANRDLAYRILYGFIGPHPPTPSLRQHLLGLTTD